MIHRLLRALSALCLVCLLCALCVVHAQLTPIPQDGGGTGLGLALRRLGVTGRVLYVTAHPDDEHNGVLVALSRGRGIRTGLLTLTRGEGGQNAIGPELFEALGILRTEELDALHRYDGVEQYFSLAYEFGYSFSVEETFKKWGHDETLGDVVQRVRAFQPDVILTLPLEAKGGGQHHQAAARLAVEAFRAAADPARFPEQLTGGLAPWQARKVYQGGVGGGAGAVPRRRSRGAPEAHRRGPGRLRCASPREDAASAARRPRRPARPAPQAGAERAGPLCPPRDRRPALRGGVRRAGRA